MPVFKHAVSVSCLLATLSIMGLTFHTMVRQPHEVLSSPGLSAQVATVGAATADAPLDTAAVTHNDDARSTATLETIAIPDTALTGEADTIDSTLMMSDAFSIATLEKQIHSRTNIIRSQNNLPALRFDAELSSVALTHSADMLKGDYFSHTDTRGCDLACRAKTLSVEALTIGENLGEYRQYQSFSESELAATFIEMWLKSSTHRDHLFSSAFDREGIGIAIKGDRIVVTVLYAQ